MAKSTVKLKDKNGNVVKAKKNNKGFWDFYCPCGSVMWDNRSKKKQDPSKAKWPDLKCKADGKKDRDFCSCGDEYPFGFYINEGHKKQLGYNTKGSKGREQQTENTVRNKSGIPVSMYAAWAKDMALYLAKESGVKDWDGLQEIFDTCLVSTGESLDKYISKLNTEMKSSNSKEIEDDDDDFGADPEDVDVPDDLEEDDDKDEEESVDVGDEDAVIDFPSEIDSVDI